MLGHVDAVHGAYYLLMWLEVRLAGHGELALRLPSVAGHGRDGGASSP